MLKLNNVLQNTRRKLMANSKNKDSESDGVGTVSLLLEEHAPCLEYAGAACGTGTTVHPY